MKKTLLLYLTLLLLCFCGVEESYAQFAFASNRQNPTTQPPQEHANSVIFLLNRLEIIHKVNFVYQRELIEGKIVSIPINENDKLESILKRILPPMNLTFKKLKGGGSYTILPIKSSKTSGNQIEEVTNADNSSSIGLLEKKPFDLSPTTSIMAVVEIKGKVTDSETGEGLPGVNVTIKGTQKGVITDPTGAFSINIPNKNAILVFSYVGYEAQEVTAGNQVLLNVILKTDSKTLNEVVVVGFGTQKKINATGAISSMGTKELVQSPVANISNSLVGRLPGLFATQSGGEPGNDGSKIRIRGVGTFSGNTDPLVLVDGVQVDNYNNIDPNEIETVTILKDASSTAVYGIRGANGVLIITTKRGKSGPPKVSYTFNQGFNSFTDMRQMMNSADYATHFNDALKADAYVTGAAYTPRYTPEQIELYANGKDPVFYPNMNWADVMFKKTSTQFSTQCQY